MLRIPADRAMRNRLPRGPDGRQQSTDQADDHGKNDALDQQLQVDVKGEGDGAEAGPGPGAGVGGPGGISFNYTFDSSTNASDPGTGKLRFNYVGYTTATKLYIDDFDIFRVLKWQIR